MKVIVKKSLIICVLIVTVCVSCKKDKDTQHPKEELFNELDYVIDDTYSIGDARRYGLNFDNANQTHSKSQKTIMETVLDVAELGNIEVFFQKGYYATNLVLNTRKNINLRFNNSEFSLIHIVQANDSLIKPENIKLKGTIISYASLGIIGAKDVEIDSILLKSDLAKNLWGLRGSGCHIYFGCKNISINYLEIDDFGSGSVEYQNNHAALAIDGWGNNPENVQIKKVYIKSTDRHGVYITGNDHIIDEIVIDKFGMGTSDFMSAMQDADKGEEKDFKAVWINRSYNSFIERLIVNEMDSKGKYTVHFDEGDISRPFTIGNFKVINDNPKIEILKNENTGVIVEVYD